MSYSAAIITISDSCYKKKRTDSSGPALNEILTEHGVKVTYTAVIPDDMESIRSELIKCADELKIPLVLTTGGTGLAFRDITPEATDSVIERRVPGISEAMRAESMKITPRGCLSRGISGTRGKTWIINLPGSKKAATENLLAVIGAVPHGLDMLHSPGSLDCAAENE